MVDWRFWLPWMKDWKNLTITLLALLVVALGSLPIAQNTSILLPWAKDPPEGELVSVLDVVLDRVDLQTLDILFDRPLGEGQIGEILTEEPADIEPELGGVWRWRATNMLRFEPTDRFAMATRYEIGLSPDRIIHSGQLFDGNTRLWIVTDQFSVRQLDTYEQSLADPANHVIFRGEVRFNYPVSPPELTKHFRLFDVLKGEDDPIALTLETTYPSRQIAFRSAPLVKQKEERQVTFRISSDLTAARGNVSLTSAFVKSVPLGSRENLAMRRISAVPGREKSVIHLRFSSPVDPDIAPQYLTLNPAVSYHLSASRNALTLTGKFAPGAIYEVAVEEGLPALDESVLAESLQHELQIPNLPPEVDFAHEGEFLSASGNRTVTIQSINVDQVELTVDRVYRNNLFALFRFAGYSYRSSSRRKSRIARGLGDRIAKETLQLDGSPNQLTTKSIDLDRYIKDQEPGLYRIGIFRPDHYRGAQRWLLITDLGIVAKKSGNEFLVWISSFSDLSATSQARVHLLSDRQQLMVSGRTNADGVWRTGNLGELFKKHQPYMLTVQKGDDYSFLLLDRHTISTSGFDVAGSIAGEAGYQAFFYGERNLYRPGETLKGLAIVRDGRLRTPPAMPLLIRHRDPRGKQQSLAKLETNEDGLGEFTLDIPVYARTGNHKLELVIAENVIGNYQFQVEEFVPDRIKVEILTAKEAFGVDEGILGDVAGSYLFGGPAANLAVESRVWLRSRVFASRQHPKFVFHNADRKFDAHQVFSGEERLDEAGKWAFSVTLATALKAPSSLQAVITARVQEQGGRGVTAVKRVTVHPYPYYVGLRRTEKGYAQPGREVQFEYLVLDPLENPTPSANLQVQLLQDRWHTVLRQTASGSYRYESTVESILIQSRDLAGGNTGGSFTLVAPDYGSYRVVITDSETGASSQVDFYASGWGYSPWAIKNPNRIELDLDQQDYPSGSSAQVQIKAPFPGKVWLTVERDEVYYSRVFELSGNTAQITLPIRRDYRPNVYVTATLVRSADELPPGQPGRAFGAVPLFVDFQRNRLSVEVVAPDLIRPHSQLSVEVLTRPDATVTVAAVDEGILQLINQQTPDPFPFFYRKLALGVRSYDTFALLMAESNPGEDHSDAGGGAPPDPTSQFVQTEGIRRAKPVTFWSGIVRADSRGKATVQFEVPEFQGALRIMAVAHSKDRFGSSRHFTRVRNPLVLLPTFPRFLSFGENLRIPVTVRNETGSAGVFELSLHAEGPLSHTGESTRNLRIANNSEKTTYFNMESGDRTGQLSLNLDVSGNGETTKASSAFLLRPDLPFQTVGYGGSITEITTTLAPDDVATIRRGSVQRRLHISQLPLIQFSGKLRRLLRYPYGCLEQVTSRVFPLVYFGTLAKELDPDLFTQRDPSELIQAGLRRIASMQLHSGGFALWSSGRTHHLWGTIYATHFLVEAHRAGHFVETFLYDGALQFLENNLKARASYNAEELERAVYALYVLARAGKADLGTMDFVRERHGAQLKPESRALLGAAYAALGNREVLDEMVRGLEDVQQIERQTGSNLNSTTRNRALLLLAFLDAAPEAPRVPLLVEHLSRDAATKWWNTQESGFVFLALGQFFRQQQERPPYSGRVFAGDRHIGTFDQQSKAFYSLPTEEPIRIEMDTGYEAGSAFYFLSTRGVPDDASFAPQTQGLEIQREFRSRDGRRLDLNAVKQGDLIIVQTRVRSVQGPVNNVVVQNLLPSGLEVENPRLKTTEKLSWMTGGAWNLAHLDMRDDRILIFTHLPAQQWRQMYSILRAVIPGTFRLPPVQAEAMYNQTIRGTGPRGTIRVEVSQ